MTPILAATRPETILQGALTGALGAVSVPATVVVLLVILTGVSVWGVMMARRAATTRRSGEAKVWALEQQLQGLRGLAADAERDREEMAEVLGLQKRKTEALRSRSRILEKILAISARFNATRNMGELVDKITAAVEEVGGFRKSVLYLWSDKTRAYEARGFAGISSLSKSQLAGMQVPGEEFAELTDPRFRYSNCFLVLQDSRGIGDGLFTDLDDSPVPGIMARDWSAAHLLIAPLTTSTGETLGYLSLDEPADGLIPGMVEIRQLEFLVYQATIALESAAVYDRLASNNAELSLASEKLNSLADMKTNFVANVSHELRTPLTSISAYAELLQSQMGSLSEEARGEFLKVIHNESLKLTGIINDILDIGEMENGRPRLHREEADIVSLVRHLEESWRSRALERDITLEVRAGAESIVLPGDKTLLNQLLTKLVGNAFKFNRDGGRVTITVEETGTAVRMTVEDTGIGIPEDKLGQIFESFYQVDGSATREHNGQGLGLAICHDIVTHHDGRIWAENLQPQGARFTVLLPRRPAVLQSIQPGDRYVAHLDPGEFVQRMMHWISESLGAQVVTLMQPDAGDDYLQIKAAIGLPESVVQSARIRKGSGVAGKVWATGRTLLVEDLTSDQRFLHEINEPRYSTPSLLCVPLVRDRDLIGVLAVNNRQDGRPLDDDDRLLLEAMAPRLTRMLTVMDTWQGSAREFAALGETLRSVTPVGRPGRESILDVCREACLATARRLMLPDEDLQPLAFTLEFHDVGMRAVPPQLLNRPGPLDDPARLLVRQHVEVGLEILAPLDPGPRTRQLVLHHHENFDGSGYPAGLAGEAIPLGARLLRLTDTMAALLCPRPWRPALSLDEALAEVRKGSGSAYCPRLTEPFLREIEERRDRILSLQAFGDEDMALHRPALDRRGMIPVRP
ncbi:MAG: ATP-binding protein [Candidatus Krumholzibacteriia bacterium]